MLKASSSAMASKNETKRKHKDSVVNDLKDLFGNVLHIDIIRSVASECNFDVERSSNVLLEMTNHIEQQPVMKKDKPKPKKSPQHTPPPRKPDNVPSRLQHPPTTIKSRKTLELERVINNIRQGYKVLVILRGLPGSGKSRLAVAITDVTMGPGNNSHHILSTDDFFVQHRGYVFDPNRLHEAHEWNHRRAFQAMSRGLSPVIIDNTNTQMWEMKPYAMMATDYGYIIEILEPDTFWCFNEKELAKRNVHNVSKTKIKDMLDRYEKNVTSQKLLCAYNLAYKFQKPPQFRLLPPIVQNGFANFRFQQQNGYDGVTKSRSTSALNQRIVVENGIETINLMDFSDIPNEETAKSQNDNQNWNFNPVDEILMCTEDNSGDVLLPNQVETPSFRNETRFPNIENAWGVNEKALQSWDIVTPVRCEVDSAPLGSNNEEEPAKPETRDSSSNVEPSDCLRGNSEVPFGMRVIIAQSRDINKFSPVKTLAPPKKTMVDQSCITEDLVEDTENEENRIKDLMDLFPRVPRSSLQELFNKCNKNFHWTVDLLLDDNNLDVTEGKEEETELKADAPVVEIVDSSDSEEEQGRTKEVKVFKRKTISDDSLELKKCLEGKIDINKEHYSEHVYRVKQTRFGSFPESHEPQPSTSTVVNLDSDLESDDDDSSLGDDPKNMIELNLGETFVNQLETMFGGDDCAFPRGFQPVVQMPHELARLIYSFYVESVCQQMENQSNVLDNMLKEDEEFARKLQLQEEAAANAIPEKPPNLKEIMDEQVALNIHRRDVDEWRSMTADNLAARLTKQKLFNTFPKVDQSSLIEIWHAYNYDYNKTVDVLVSSLGPDDINGPRETISEPPLSTTTLEEMREAEVNCMEIEESEEQQPATFYRDEANKHLRRREELYEKAKTYYQRGMTEVAMFYSELAKKETKYFDKANHIAAAAFIDEHSKRLQKFDTLDLHYFYVKEAIPNLDIFIDRNINLLKGSTKRGQDLFVITGRGKNSEGGRCKIKPAVMTRLKKRKIGFVQLNPGLLKIRVLRESPMTSDIP